jgi:predicted nucleotidyltransferase
MIRMDKQHLDMIKSILIKYPYTFYAFGSRTKGNQQPFSDFDICFIEPIPHDVLRSIHQEFEESNIPFKIDIIDFKRASPEFQKIIQKDLVPILKR